MSRSPLLRPLLLPGLARVWRGPRTLQLGLGPARAVLLDLPDPRTARVLDLLDGAQSERVVLLRAAQLGVPPDDARGLLDALHTVGLVIGAHHLLPGSLPDGTRHRLTGEAAALALSATDIRSRPGGKSPRTPAQTLRRRAGARVVVAGRGRLAAAVAVALAESGVGHVHPDLTGVVTRQELPGSPLTVTDAGRPRGEAVAAAVREAAPGTQTRAVRRGTASLVVQLGHDQPVALLAAGHARRRQAHLAVSVREGTAVVGPLVPSTGGPCLNCVELHRRDRDADWPQLAAQLAPGTTEPCCVSTALAATGYTVSEALEFLDGGVPETLGAAIEIGVAGRFRRRTWTPHPACGCARRGHRKWAPPHHQPMPGAGPERNDA